MWFLSVSSRPHGFYLPVQRKHREPYGRNSSMGIHINNIVLWLSVSLLHNLMLAPSWFVQLLKALVENCGQRFQGTQFRSSSLALTYIPMQQRSQIVNLPMHSRTSRLTPARTRKSTRNCCLCSDRGGTNLKAIHR